MQAFGKTSLVAVLAMLLVAPLWAEETKVKKPKKDPLANSPAFNVFKLPEAVTLTEEQKTKLADIKKEFEPKVRELVTKKEAVLTEDQKKARAAATKEAKAADKKGKELQEAVTAALKLTDEQAKKRSEIDDELKKLNGEIRGKIDGMLTAEQKAAIKAAKKKDKAA